MRFVLLAALLTAASPGLAQDQAAAAPIQVELSSFKFTPSTISLEHGRAYVLHLVNMSDGGHNFVAKSFFAAATIAPADRRRVVKGGVELDGKDAANIHFTAPVAGTYKIHCSHFLHSTFGMTGEIVVR